MYKPRDWETPQIDLNLRHYSGKPTDVYKQIQNDIVGYLQMENVPQKQKEIYSAIYNAINLYKEITYLPGADYDTDDTYLSYAIKYFNEDFKYLAEQYNTPEHPDTITALARIKSPIKFIEKVLQKVDEYEEEERDFRYFNESLRDIIGVKFVVNPPPDIKAKGPEAESDFFYDVFYNLMKYRGINNPDDEKPGFGQYRFLNVNTRYDPHKLERLKARPQRYGFDQVTISKITPEFFIPENRPAYMDRKNVDSKVKDYHKWPKELGYQGVHTCVIPDFAFSLEHLNIPTCIIPPTTCDYAIEYQFRTKDEDYHAEYGIASHEKKYKPGEKSSYHRLLVPFYIAFDDPEDEIEATYEPKTQTSPSENVHEYYKRRDDDLRLRNFAESFRKFYRTSFESYFGVSFKTFRDSFTSREKNLILAGKARPIFDEKNNRYVCEEIPPFVFINKSQSDNIASLLKDPGSVKARELMDYSHLSDCIFEVYSDTKGEQFSPFRTKGTPIRAFTVRQCSVPERSRRNSSKKKIYQDENLPEY